MTVLSGAAATDVGRVRQMNEDRYLVADGLFAVADGVGGHQAGEVAAQASVETLEESFGERTIEGLIDAIQEANRAVWQLAQEKAERRGMGTTITALALVEHEGDDALAIANVGDSRAYLFQRGDLVQVTEDHSLVEELVREGQLTPEEAQVHPQRSIITRALGMEPEIEVDAWTLVPYAGDRILLCSDGLTNELGVDKIAATLRQLAEPQDAANELVRQARAHGGNDNITVVVVDVVDDGGRAERASAALGAAAPKPGAGGPSRGTPAAPRRDADDDRAGGKASSTALATQARPVAAGAPPAPPDDRPRRFTWRVALFVVLVVAVLGIAAVSVAWYARSAYFVGLNGDQVAIFKGRPGGLLWFDPTLDQRTALTRADVPAGRLPDLQSGKEEPDKASALRYVDNLRQEAAQAADATSTTTTMPGATPTTAKP
jgi:protein phosphatase